MNFRIIVKSYFAPCCSFSFYFLATQPWRAVTVGSFVPVANITTNLFLFAICILGLFRISHSLIRGRSKIAVYLGSSNRHYRRQRQSHDKNRQYKLALPMFNRILSAFFYYRLPLTVVPSQYIINLP